MQDSPTAKIAQSISRDLDELCSLVWSDPQAADLLIDVACRATENLGYLLADNWSPLALKLQNKNFIPTAYVIAPHKVSAGVKEASQFPSYFSKKNPGRPKRAAILQPRSPQAEALELYAYLIRTFVDAVLPSAQCIATDALRRHAGISAETIATLTSPKICGDIETWARCIINWIEARHPVSMQETDRRIAAAEGDLNPLDTHGYFWTMALNRIFREDGKRRSKAPTKNSNPKVELKIICKELLRKDFRLRPILSRKTAKEI